MPRKCRKKRVAVEEEENGMHIGYDKENMDQNRPLKKARHVPPKVKAMMDELDIEVESRRADLRQQAETLSFSLQCAFRTQLSKLPRKIRKMPLSDFTDKYAGEISQVMGEDVQNMQKDLDNWVAQTPRLRSTRKNPGTAVRRSTRASTRKATLASTRKAPPASIRKKSDSDPVYETPSRRARSRRQAAVNATAKMQSLRRSTRRKQVTTAKKKKEVSGLEQDMQQVLKDKEDRKALQNKLLALQDQINKQLAGIDD